MFSYHLTFRISQIISKKMSPFYTLKADKFFKSLTSIIGLNQLALITNTSFFIVPPVFEDPRDEKAHEGWSP